MLRLFCDWRGDVTVMFPEYAYDVPEYEYLLANWRQPDVLIADAILAACRRHVVESHDDNTKASYDSGEYPRTFMRDARTTQPDSRASADRAAF